MAKKYKVVGRFEGKRISQVVTASSKTQAKLRAGFNSGFGGNSMKSFMKSRKIKVKVLK